MAGVVSHELSLKVWRYKEVLLFVYMFIRLYPKVNSSLRSSGTISVLYYIFSHQRVPEDRYLCKSVRSV